ncbi:hypothetical protein AOLI_G00040970 [Acnodon oligacanthus]
MSGPDLRGRCFQTFEQQWMTWRSTPAAVLRLPPTDLHSQCRLGLKSAGRPFKACFGWRLWKSKHALPYQPLGPSLPSLIIHEKNRPVQFRFRLSLRPPEAHPQSGRCELQHSAELPPDTQPTQSGRQQSAAHRGCNHRHVELQSFIQTRAVRLTRSY